MFSSLDDPEDQGSGSGSCSHAELAFAFSMSCIFNFFRALNLRCLSLLRLRARLLGVNVGDVGAIPGVAVPDQLEHLIIIIYLSLH